MATTTLTLPILGMTCASCVSTITRALNHLDGVSAVTVNLAGGKAQVTYNPQRVGTAQIVQAVTAVGYEIATAELTLRVSGMTCASCVAHVEGALTGLPGVTKVAVNLGLGLARIEYIPGLVTATRWPRRCAR